MFNLATEIYLGIKINQSVDVISHMAVFVVPTISFVGNHQYRHERPPFTSIYLVAMNITCRWKLSQDVIWGRLG
jgi:hypothetical protein